jgi:hypothetical protein
MLGGGRYDEPSSVANTKGRWALPRGGVAPSDGAHLDISVHTQTPAAEEPMPASGRARLDGLLEGEEVVRPQVVAGARNTECYTVPDIFWIDLIP